MKLIKLFGACLFIALLSFACKNPISDDSAGTESAPQGPNIGGFGMPRGIIKNTPKATPGYIFFSPLLSSTTYLSNSEGDIVHTWESDYGPSGWIYLKDNGNLIRGGRDPEALVFDGGGQGGFIQEFNWEGEIVWEYKSGNEEYLTHHDVDIMPNGNILAIAWESKTYEEAIQAGRKPELIPKAGLWPDMIVELKPKGNNDAEIVWEWHMWDHMVQDFDASLANYGKPDDHPELLDINAGSPLPDPVTVEELDERRSRNNANPNDTPDNQGSDLYHLNAINYNPELDQIVFSSPDLNEIFIIDHSTSTAEAAGHTGGRSGKGGDFLYRWGNPQNYGRGDSTHQKLAGQHDIKWIPKGYPGEGNLIVFNNVVPNKENRYSEVIELKTPIEETGYTIVQDGTYGPEKFEWAYSATDSVQLIAPFISGAHRMKNGNTFITEGPKGRYIEVTPSGEILWEYWTPYAGYARNPDGTFPQPVGPFVYATFRATHIATDHPAVQGKELQALDPQPEFYSTDK